MYDGVLIDMDGILQACGAPIPGASDLISMLMERGIPFVVVTNECRYTNRQLSDKLLPLLGVRIPPERFYSAANSCADFLKRWCSKGSHQSDGDAKFRVFVAGELGLKTAVAEVAHMVSDHGGSSHHHEVPGKADERASLAPFCPDYVILGARFEESTSDIESALEGVKNGAKLLYTCPDLYETDSLKRPRLGMPLPHVELITRIVSGVTGFNVGRPNAFMARRGLDMLHSQLKDENLKLRKVLFIGDSLDTDIRLATENGLDSVLILSAGEVSKQKLKRSCLRPDFVSESVELMMREIPHHFVQRGGVRNEMH